MSHPYQGSVKDNDDLQQGFFPSWHNRRQSHTSEQILETGKRKNGSFQALQEAVKKQQEKDEKKKTTVQEQAEDQTISNKITSIVRDTTSGPAIIVHDAPNEQGGNKDTFTMKKRPSVRFSKEPHFIKN